jgi:hypothetical protein
MSPQGDWCQSTYLTQINISIKATTKTPSHQALKQRPKIVPSLHLFIALGVLVSSWLCRVGTLIPGGSPNMPFFCRGCRD